MPIVPREEQLLHDRRTAHVAGDAGSFSLLGGSDIGVFRCGAQLPAPRRRAGTIELVIVVDAFGIVPAPRFDVGDFRHALGTESDRQHHIPVEPNPLIAAEKIDDRSARLGRSRILDLLIDDENSPLGPVGLDHLLDFGQPDFIGPLRQNESEKRILQALLLVRR